MKLLQVISTALAFTTAVIAAPVDEPEATPATVLPTTAGGDDDFYPFTLSLTQYCNGKDKKTRGTIHLEWITYSILNNVEFRPSSLFHWSLGEKDIKVTYDEPNSYANFDYGSCGWGMGQQKSCGWCIIKKDWTKSSIDCGVDPKSSRSYSASCTVDMAWNRPRAKLLAVRESAMTIPEKGQSNATIQEAELMVSVIASDAVDNAYSLVPFDMKITEYCEGSEGHPLMAKAHFSFRNFAHDFYFHQNKYVTIVGGILGKDLHLGPYDYFSHTMAFGYRTCGWKDSDIQDCAACVETQSWTSSALNCAAGNQAPRTRKVHCAIMTDRKSNKPREVPLPATGVVAVQATTTITGIPRIIVSPASSPTATGESKADITILPFHVKLTEYCENGARKAKGHYTNGNLQLNFNLPPGLINNIDHRVPGYAPFGIGPFDYSNSRLRFNYASAQCEWFDNETWKQCGACRATQWSSRELNCAGGGSRTKDMDCSFILGRQAGAQAPTLDDRSYSPAP